MRRHVAVSSPYRCARLNEDLERHGSRLASLESLFSCYFLETSICPGNAINFDGFLCYLIMLLFRGKLKRSLVAHYGL